MNLSSDQLDAFIYFLFYCVGIGILTTFGVAVENFVKYLTNRKLLRIKCLDSKR